jgi:ATP-dependent helicase/nuclease subunit A
MSLSDSQRRAVERTEQNVCVVAGPGSGKTRVLIERFAWLVEKQGVDPTRILAITFTEKAATEIKKRLIERFAARSDLRESIERAWVSTIDGFCTRVLRENAIAAGLAPDFAMLEQGAADLLAREAAEQALDALFRERCEEMRALLEAVDLSTQDDGRQPDLVASLLDVYDAMRVSGMREIPPAPSPADVYPEARRLVSSISDARLQAWSAEFSALALSPVTREHLSILARFNINLNQWRKNLEAKQLKNDVLPSLTAQWLGEYYADLHELLRLAIARIDATYRARKRAESVVDFADLEEETVRLLESDADVRRVVAGRFDEVLMDELQDTNRLQWRLVSLIRTRFFAVGDINQSIYGFRHADPEVFTAYQASGAHVDELPENYRSRAEILAAVSKTLDGCPGIEPRPLASKKQFAPIVGPVVERLVGESPDVEAALVASRIRQFTDCKEFRYNQIAVLVRALNSTESFERAFDRFGIPFLLTGGRTFLEARETKDLTAFLAALVNPLDEIAVVGILRSPMVGLSDQEIFALGREGRRDEFQNRFGEIRKLAGFVAPDRLIAIALDQCGYLIGLPERSRANVEKLLAWLRREFRNRPRPLAELLEDLEALRFTRSEAEAPPPEASDAVRVMTIHAAKGLEFPVVFVSALHRRPEAGSAPIIFSATEGLGVKWRHPVTGKGESDPIHRKLKVDGKIRDDAEENRLLYVAMTRAEQRLILSYTERKTASPWQKLVEAAIPHVTALDRAPDPPPASGIATAIPTTELLAPPQVSGQYDSSAAVTSIAMFHACPRKYYLDRYLGLEAQATAPGTGAIELGLAVHSALAGQPAKSPEAAALAERFAASDLGRRAASATRIEREFDFIFETEDVILRGQIDLWFEEAGELILVDYKTDRDESCVDGYALQLQLYALALERYAGRRPDRAVLYYLRSNRQVEVGVTGEDLDAARAVVREFREAQETVEFPLKVGEQCGKCSFFGGFCPAKPFS